MHPKQFVTFVAGVVSACAFLIYCGGENPRDSVRNAHATTDGGSGSSAGSESVSGSRLKLMRTVGADGLKVVVPGTYYDAELQADCRSGRLADGKSYCIPGVQGFISYADSGCTQRQFTITYAQCDASITHGLIYDAMECAGVKVFKLAGRKQKGAPIYYKDSEGSCLDYTSVYEDVAVFSSMTEMQPSEFVELSTTHD